MKSILIIFTITLGLSNVFSQSNSKELSLLISSRVDTTSINVKSIIKLYENYYNSRPDSIYDNPYWNSMEKKLYKDFDFSRLSIFQGGMKANSLFKYFSPFVMSVEPLGDKYQIRVLFSSPTTDPKYSGSKVWCIQKLNAVKENEVWVLENLMVDLSKSWKTHKIGFIEYIYPSTHDFDIEEAQKAKEYCDNFIKLYNPTYNSKFNYYVTSSVDDMGLLENFDYYFVGITTGKAREGMLLTAKGNENYPHEFVHKLMPKNNKRGYVIEEGLAEYFGTKKDKIKYKESLSKLAVDLLNSSDKINFKSVVSQEIRFNGYQTAYPTGAAICELVYSKKGDEGLLKLMLADTSDYENVLSSIKEITNLNEENIIREWKEILKEYNR